MLSCFCVMQPVGERVSPAELGCVVVSISHLGDVRKCSDAVHRAAIDVSCVVDVGLVCMPVDARSPMLPMRLGWVHGRSEAVDQF